MIFLYLGLAFVSFNMGTAVKSSKQIVSKSDSNIDLMNVLRIDTFEFDEYRSVLGDVLYFLAAVLIFIAILGSFMVIPAILINVFGIFVVFGLYKVMRFCFCKN